MEIEKENPAWLDPLHPNFYRWEKARNLSFKRGKFVRSLIERAIKPKNISILDLGSGEGGTSAVFSKENFVISLDLSFIRLQRQNQNVISSESSSGNSSTRNKDRLLPSLEGTKINCVNGSALQLPFSDQKFDLIIIQDVIEHLSDINLFYMEIKRVLKPEGYIYLSTPNKLSVLNFVSDPHFGLPVISILTRESIKKYFLKNFRKDDYKRNDIAQLLSLNDLQNLFCNDFKIRVNTKFAVKELFNDNGGIVWSDFHLKLIGFCKIIKLDKLIIKIANDKSGIINKYFTPTFYVVLNGK